MRATLAFTLPLLSLAACGGGGGDTVSAGTVAPPVAGTTTTTTAGAGAGTSAATSPGSSAPASAGTSAGTPTPTPPPAPAQSNMFDVAAATTFDAVGAVQQLGVRRTTDGRTAVLYMGNAATVAQTSGKVIYNPRDGVFTLELADSTIALNKRVNYQDPAHRETGVSIRTDEMQVPLLAGFNYLQALDGVARLSFFYKRPGSTGSFVSLAGYERSEVNATAGTATYDQGALVFGTRTPAQQVPNKGTGRYEGEFLATMAGMVDGSARVLQWIDGTSAVDVDFAKRTVGLSLTGAVAPAFSKTVVGGTTVASLAVNDASLTFPSGSTFFASGSAAWADAGGAFAGKFSSAGFRINGADVPIDFGALAAGGTAAGASSIDGAFYGPNAVNLGGSFRITGGIPNQRVDVLGAFTGVKK